MNIHPRNNSTNRFPLFDEIFSNYENSKVFDFGGSSGNLLYFSNGKIREEKYTCLDISVDALNTGRKEFPNSTWVHYNRFNWMYNPQGNTEFMFPNINTDQDFIWAYSVFSHVDANEFIKTILWMTTFNYKKIAVSFLDIDAPEMKEYFYNKRVSEYGNCNDMLKTVSSKDTDYFYFLDNDAYEINKYECDYTSNSYFLSFFNTEWLIFTLKQHGINSKVIRPGNGYVPFLIIERI